MKTPKCSSLEKIGPHFSQFLSQFWAHMILSQICSNSGSASFSRAVVTSVKSASTLRLKVFLGIFEQPKALGI